MKTTLHIDDAVYRDLKVLAARTDRSMTGLVEEAVADLVRRSRQAGTVRAFRLVTFRGRGRKPGAGIDDTSSLLDLTGRNR